MHALIVSNKYGLGKELKLFQQVANGEKLKMLRFQGQKTARKEIIARLSEDALIKIKAVLSAVQGYARFKLRYFGHKRINNIGGYIGRIADNSMESAPLNRFKEVSLGKGNTLLSA